MADNNLNKKNIDDANKSLAESINLTSQLRDAMSSVVSSMREKSSLDKSSVTVLNQVANYARNISSEFSSIKEIEKEIAKGRKQQQNIEKQILAIQSQAGQTLKDELKTLQTRKEAAATAERLAEKYALQQQAGVAGAEKLAERAKAIAEKEKAKLALIERSLSKEAQQVGILQKSKKAVDDIVDGLEEQVKTQKASSGMFSKIGGAISKMGMSLKAALGPMAIISAVAGAIAAAYNKGKEAAERLSGQNVELARTLGVAQSTANKLAGEVRGIGASMGITGGQATAAAGAIYSNLDGVEKLSKSTLETFVKLNVFAGMSAESIGDIRRLSKLTGEDTGKVAEQMALTAQESIKTQKVNVSMKSVMEGVGKVSNTIKLAFKGSAEELTRAFVSSKKLGLELKQVDDIANSLLNFEDSIAAEMEAELLTGKQLNLEKAREAALNNDLEGVMEEISKQGIDQASFTKMNRIQQEAVAKSIGMSRDGLADMLVSQKENTAENTDLIDTQKQGLAAMQSMASVSERLAANEEARANQFAIIFELLNPIVEAFKDLGPLVLAFITPIVKQLVPVVTKLAQNLFPAIQRLITSLVPVVTKLLEALMPVFDVIVELAIKLLPVIQQIFDAIIPVVMSLLDALMPIIDAVVELAKVLLPIVVEVFKSLMPILLPIFKVIEGVANFITGIIEGDFNKVGAGLKKIGEGLLNLIMGIFEGLINLAIGVFEGIVQSIPGFGDTTFERVDFDDIKLATGGIVESPTRALIGEAGPEAVVPLNSDKSMNVFSKSLEEKLDRLIAAVEKGGVVMLDGQKVGEALVVNSYRTQ
jgi:plasmid maintenance system antidote protein VapI